jgi:hypothetical protein
MRAKMAGPVALARLSLSAASTVVNAATLTTRFGAAAWKAASIVSGRAKSNAGTADAQNVRSVC